METKVNIDEDLTTLAISNGDYPIDFVRKLTDLQKNKRVSHLSHLMFLYLTVFHVKLTDITLRFDNEEITAHKAILAAASPFFNNLFDG